MGKLAKIIPVAMALALGTFIFFMLGSDTSHMSKSVLTTLRQQNPKMQVARTEQGSYIQWEMYGKPADHKFRIQSSAPGTASLYNADGKLIMKMFVEQGDALVTVPKQQTVDVIGFEPFEWVE
ncbi:MAG: hypothetical protein P4L46_18050 [Fimbriimonas sp.]|nr:hypothetical protein [Fimbriimonas sp.]